MVIPNNAGRGLTPAKTYSRYPLRSSKNYQKRGSPVFCSAEGVEEKTSISEEYSKEMTERMGSNSTAKGKMLVYEHSSGMNYDIITKDIIVGSCLQEPEDVDRLKDAGVSLVICLQQDTDMAYFDLDIEPIQERAQEVGLRHVRLRINDMDPLNLRLRLPDVIKSLHHQVQNTPPGYIYIHCTAGMGRAPAVALAYMWWVQGIHLEDAHADLVSKRFCAPSLSAIRNATADLLYGGDPQDITIRKNGSSNSTSVEIAGLDVGWGARLKMNKGAGDTWSVTRTLLPGTYLYKYIMDGVWSYDADQYTVPEGSHRNNAVVVLPKGLSPEQEAARARIMQPGGQITDSEYQRIWDALGVTTRSSL